MPNISSKRSFILCVLTLLCFSFYAQGQWKNKYPKNSFKSVNIENFISIVNNEPVILKELRFSGVHDRYYLHKGMFDNFGVWTQSIYAKQYDTLLVWNDVKLFNNSDKLFKVATKGHREGSHVFTSVLIFDENNRDQFIPQSELKNQLTTYFTNLIKNNDASNVDFYIAYWSMFEKNKNSRHAIFMKSKYEQIKKKNIRRKLKKN